MWFSVKCKPSLTEASRHFFMLLRLSDIDYQDIAIPVLKRNVCFAHLESLLFAMLSDIKETIRKVAVAIIKDTKNTCEKVCNT